MYNLVQIVCKLSTKALLNQARFGTEKGSPSNLVEVSKIRYTNTGQNVQKTGRNRRAYSTQEDNDGALTRSGTEGE